MSRITKRLVDSLEAGQTAWDSDIKGFGVRCRSGSKSYVLKYRYCGRQRMYTIGRHGSPWTPETARTEAKRLLGVIASGADPAGQKQGEKSIPTMAELSEIFLEQYIEPQLKPKTRLGYGYVLKRHILPAFGKMRIDKISRQDVSRLLKKMISTPAQANTVLSKVSKMISWAEKNGYLPYGHLNPCKGIPGYRSRRKICYLSNEQIDRLHRVLDEELENNNRASNPVYAIRLILYTGARKREILDLKWSMVDYENQCIHLPDSKTGPRDIHLSKQAVHLLVQMPRRWGSEYVFTGRVPNRPLTQFQKTWERLRKKAGLDGVRIHDLRHTYASAAANSGVGLMQVKELLGHNDIKTTAGYAHPDKKSIQSSAEKIGELLSSR